MQLWCDKRMIRRTLEGTGVEQDSEESRQLARKVGVLSESACEMCCFEKCGDSVIQVCIDL